MAMAAWSRPRAVLVGLWMGMTEPETMRRMRARMSEATELAKALTEIKPRGQMGSIGCTLYLMSRGKVSASP